MGEKVRKAEKGFVELVSGDIILRRHIDKQMGLFFYIFLLFCAIIAWSLFVENQLVKVEKNDRTIESLEVSYHQRDLELVGLDQRTRIEQMLGECNSNLKAPVEPAKIVETEK